MNALRQYLNKDIYIDDFIISRTIIALLIGWPIGSIVSSLMLTIIS